MKLSADLSTRAWRLLLISICFGALCFRLWGLNGAGETWDEVAYFDAGQSYVHNLRTLDGQAADWDANHEHPPVGKWLYAAVSLGAYRAHIVDYTGGRALSAVLGTLTVLLTMLIGVRLYSRRIGLLAGGILALLPIMIALNRVYGLDTPTTFFFALTTWLLLVGLQAKRPAIWWLLCAVSLGLAIGTRLSNLLLYPFLVTVVAVVRWPVWQQRKQLAELWWIVAFALIPPLVVLLLWPWLWQDSLAHLQLTLGHWSPVASYLFGMTREWGAAYFLVYFLVTTPVVLLGLLVIFLVRTVLRRRTADWLVLLWIGWVAAFSFYSLRQGGIRYLLPMMPAVAIACAVGLSSLAQHLRFKQAFGWLTGGLVGYLLITACWSQPYQLDYYNEVVGGTAGVAKTQHFQLGWWGEGVESAVVWLNTTAPTGASVTFRAIPDRTQRLLRTDLIRSDEGTYVITNWFDRHWQGEFDPATIGYERVYSVDTHGASLAEVWQRQ